MSVIGGWVPFIGFRTRWVPVEEAIALNINGGPYRIGTHEVQINALEVEWFHHGITIAAKEIK